MSSVRRLPNPDRLSVLIATILLAYTAARLVDIPGREFGVQLPGFFLAIQINTSTFIGFLLAGLMGSGTYWLLRTHPLFDERASLGHALLPALTALVFSVPLSILPIGPLWWVVFAAAGLTLLMVLVAEFITIDPDDLRQPTAASFLVAVSFSLFLILCVSLRSLNLRLFLLLPPILAAAGLIALRTLQLRLHGEWFPVHAAAVALTAGQLAAALHYFPVDASLFGLYVVGPAYALTTLIGNLYRQRALALVVYEPAVILLALVGIALWVR